MAHQKVDVAKLQLDPWSPEYEAPVQTEGPEAAESGTTDPRAETPEWRAIPAPSNVAERRLYFVDGVRRIEARVMAQDEDGKLVHGIFASTAAGAVRVTGGVAAFDEVDVYRVLVLGSGRQRTETITAGGMRLTYDGVATPDPHPHGLSNCLQNLMRTREVELAERRLGEGTCVFADGPLNFCSAVSDPLVGVVKRILVLHLDAAHFELVGSLETGQRTPLFAIRDGKNDRYSWYLRLASTGALEHRLAGIVRLEVRAAHGIDRAVELADFAAKRLPGFASSAIRDPRAPQNLVPVGALEQELRRRMGDALLIRRGIERRIFEGVTV